MQMPSLVKYFAFVGAALLALLSFANFLLEPSTGATIVQAAAKAAPAVKHEPGASRIERWRNEQAALKAAEQAQTAENASIAAKSEPVRPTVTPPAVQTAAAPQPAAAQAPEPALQTQPAAAQPVAPAEPDPAAEAERLKAEKVKAAKARKARLARERMKAEQAARQADRFYIGSQQRSASNQQDAFYYGRRAPQGQGYAYAPRQSYGPFGW